VRDPPRIPEQLELGPVNDVQGRGVAEKAARRMGARQHAPERLPGQPVAGLDVGKLVPVKRQVQAAELTRHDQQQDGPGEGRSLGYPVTKSLGKTHGSFLLARGPAS
jgi:hypothetical protein